jgi:hypothetical protein
MLSALGTSNTQYHNHHPSHPVLTSITIAKTALIETIKILSILQPCDEHGKKIIGASKNLKPFLILLPFSSS